LFWDAFFGGLGGAGGRVAGKIVHGHYAKGADDVMAEFWENLGVPVTTNYADMLRGAFR